MKNRPSLARLGVGIVGLAGISYGVMLLLAKSQVNRPLEVAKWAIGADVVVDGIFMPATIIVGWILTVVLPDRVRRYVQGALITMAVVALVALPLIYRRGDSAPGQALLLQNYALNLSILLGIVAAAALLAYVTRVLRDQRSTVPRRTDSDEAVRK